MGAIINHGLPPGVGGREGIGIHRLPFAARAGLANALHPAFIVAACVSAVVWLIALVLIARGAQRFTRDRMARTI